MKTNGLFAALVKKSDLGNMMLVDAGKFSGLRAEEEGAVTCSPVNWEDHTFTVQLSLCITNISGNFRTPKISIPIFCSLNTILVLLYLYRSDCKSKSYLRASGPSSKWVVPQRSGGALIWELKREFNFCNYQTSKHLWFAIQNFYPQKFQIRIQNERSLVEFLSFYFFTFLAWRKIFWNFWNENDLENNKRSIKRNIFDQ